MQIVDEARIRSVIGCDATALDAVRGAFVALSEGRVTMPPILRLDLPQVRGEMDVKTAAIAGLDTFCLKISTGFFDNPAQGLPSLGGLMAVFDAANGVPRAILLENGYLTNLRTALAGAIASEALAQGGQATVAIIGAGVQARMQAQALLLVREVAEFRVFARNPDRAATCAADITRATGRPARACPTPRQATADATIIVTTTPAIAPILGLADIARGAHVTAMGSDAPHKREVATDLILAAATVCVDDRAQSEALGELRALREAGLLASLPDPCTLGDVLTGKATGRRAPDDITLCDLSGTGAQDTAIATEVLRRLSRVAT